LGCCLPSPGVFKPPPPAEGPPAARQAEVEQHLSDLAHSHQPELLWNAVSGTGLGPCTPSATQSPPVPTPAPFETYYSLGPHFGGIPPLTPFCPSIKTTGWDVTTPRITSPAVAGPPRWCPRSPGLGPRQRRQEPPAGGAAGGLGRMSYKHINIRWRKRSLFLFCEIDRF